jgi:DNA replication protein DnaD
MANRKLRELDHQVNLRNAELETEKANILDEDKSKAKIKECAAEIEKVLLKYNCNITPMLQILDQSFENAIINKALKEKGEVIKK